MTGPEQHRHDHHHHHHDVRLDEADWQAMVDDTELMGEMFLAFVTDTAAWLAAERSADAPPVRRILDIGSGPGVGTCELARLFPDAQVTAVDSSPAMLERATQRAARLGLAARVDTRLAELPGGLDGLQPADVSWASMSLHHVGDEVAALRALGARLAPHGLLAIAELAEPMRVLPDDADVGRPGLTARLDRAGTTWFAGMRAGLPGAVASAELTAMVAAAGLEVVGSRVVRRRIDAPLTDQARGVALGHVRRARRQFAELLDDDDLAALDALADADDGRSVLHRADVFLAASSQILIAR